MEATPDQPGGLHLLGLVVQAWGQLKEAEGLLRRAAAVAPGTADFHNLAAALVRMGDLDGAAGAFRQVVRLDPRDVRTRRNLIALHHQRGDFDFAVAERRTLVEVLAGNPDQPREHSDLLLTLHYSDDAVPERLFEEHPEWARRYEDPLLREDLRRTTTAAIPAGSCGWGSSPATSGSTPPPASTCPSCGRATGAESNSSATRTWPSPTR